MLYSVYSKKQKGPEDMGQQLNDVQALLLSHLHSESWYERLVSALPEGWEKTYEVKLYSLPYEAYSAFREESVSRDAWDVYERIIKKVLTSEGIKATPGRYVEHKKRDNDYPMEENVWVVDQYREETIYPDFHVNHRLVWITAERQIDFFSNENLNNLPFSKYTIHVYNPEASVLTEVQQLKLNNEN